MSDRCICKLVAPSRRRMLVATLDHQQECPCLHDVASLGRHASDRSRPGGFQFILHLHRFHHHQGLFRLDYIADPHRQFHDQAWHRCCNQNCTTTAGGRSLLRSQRPRIFNGVGHAVLPDHHRLSVRTRVKRHAIRSPRSATTKREGKESAHPRHRACRPKEIVPHCRAHARPRACGCGLAN